MPKDKSLGSNPALKFHKDTKRNQINKGKADKSKARDAKLQHRRPDQIQAQIGELKALESSGKINASDRRLLQSLERDLVRVNRLRAQGSGNAGVIVTSDNLQRREKLAEKRRARLPTNPERSVYYDPVFNPYGVPPPGMPYREVDEDDDLASDTSTNSSVACIPMPPGTPPPLPASPVKAGASAVLLAVKTVAASHGQSQTRKPGRVAGREQMEQRTKGASLDSTNSGDGEKIQTHYSAEPVLRNFVKESARFVPHRLRQKERLPHTQNTQQASAGHLSGRDEAQSGDKTSVTAESRELEKVDPGSLQEAGQDSAADGEQSESPDQLMLEGTVAAAPTVPRVAKSRRLNIAP